MSTQVDNKFHPEAGAVLIVDDEDDLRDTVAYFIQQRGCEVLQARNGLEALAVLEKRANEMGLPGVQCILSDWMMPEMNGIELLRSVRGNPLLNIPFVIVSGAVTQEQLLEALRLGADSVILKPFAMELILRKITDAIAHHAKREVANLLKP
jgi:CheY-like chemotaxis protein